MRGHFRTGDLVRGHFCIAQPLAGCEIDPATERDAKLASQQGGMTQGGTPQQRAGPRSRGRGAAAGRRGGSAAGRDAPARCYSAAATSSRVWARPAAASRGSDS